MIRDQNIPALYKVRIVFLHCRDSNFPLALQAHLGRNRIKPEAPIRKIKSKKSSCEEEQPPKTPTSAPALGLKQKGILTKS
jgi:hypothetical protein